MKKILGCILFASLMFNVNGQQIFAETGKFISGFQYKNSSGDSPLELKSGLQNQLGLGFRTSLFKTPVHLSLGLAYNKFGATSNDEILGNYSEWEASFLDVSTAIDYEFNKPNMKVNERNKFSYYLKGAFATDILINGKQRLNNLVFDLGGVEEFDTPVFFMKAGAGVNYYFTRSYVVYVQYLFGRSILFGNYEGQEQLRFQTHSMSIGISVNLAFDR